MSEKVGFPEEAKKAMQEVVNDLLDVTSTSLKLNVLNSNSTNTAFNIVHSAIFLYFERISFILLKFLSDKKDKDHFIKATETIMAIIIENMKKETE